MKKIILATLVAAAGMCGSVLAQQGAGPANIAGTLYASNFSGWNVPQGNNGPLSWSYQSACNSTTSGGATFKPFVVGSPIRIVDNQASLSETVTVTSVRPAGSGCQITVNPSNFHQEFYLTSATAGLQEAINFANGQPYVVIVTPDFIRLGGTTSTITSAVGNSNVSIIDERTATLAIYTWNGTAYVGSTYGAGSYVSTTGGYLCFATIGSSCTTTVTQDLIAPGFSITSFAPASTTIEIGATSTNPAFTAAYSATPTSATITNTDGTNSPFTLTTPFTSATITGSFVHTAQATTTFTLSAVSTSTQTRNAVINWFPRVFAGVGTGTPTGATASGTSAVMIGATGTLATAGLSTSQVGATFGPFAPNAQNLYLILIGGSHTQFKDPATGFAVPFNAPVSFSFTNANGSVVAMYIYQSSNALTSSAQSVQVVN